MAQPRDWEERGLEVIVAIVWKWMQLESHNKLSIRVTDKRTYWRVSLFSLCAWGNRLESDRKGFSLIASWKLHPSPSPAGPRWLAGNFWVSLGFIQLKKNYPHRIYRHTSCNVIPRSLCWNRTLMLSTTASWTLSSSWRTFVLDVLNSQCHVN